eukprot:SAG22_NODE_2324_length_2712_cov_2.484118_1_plen_747_part_10
MLCITSLPLHTLRASLASAPASRPKMSPDSPPPPPLPPAGWVIGSSLTFPGSSLNTVNRTAFESAFCATLAEQLGQQANASASEAVQALSVSEHDCAVLALSPGSIVVDFAFAVSDEAELDPTLSAFAALQVAAVNLQVVAGGSTHVANTAYLKSPSASESCVPVTCSHDAPADCEPASCDEGRSCELTDCPAELWNSTECSTVSAPGFSSVRVRCTDAPCVPVSCGCGTEHTCEPKVCVDDNGRETGGYSCNPCHAVHHTDDGLSFWPLLMLALGIAVGITALLQALATGECCGRSINPPFTVVMFFVGYLIASWVSHEHEIGKTMKDWSGQSHILIDSVDAWKATHPHVILFCLLPPLLFEDASSMDFYTFRKVLKASALLAGPGVAMSMFLTAGLSMAVFGFETTCLLDPHTGAEVCEDQLPVAAHLLLGGMLAATDPVAVCAVLNDLGAPDKLNFMIAGESLLNDGTAVVAFFVMQGVAGGCGTTFFDVTLMLVRLAGGGILWGLAMAVGTYHFIKHSDNPQVEISAIVLGTFVTFWAAENVLHVSGVLGTVVYGVQTARTSFLAFDEESHHANHAFWHEVGYVATAMIFFLAGVISEHKLEVFVAKHGELELLGLVSADERTLGHLGFLTGQFMLSFVLYVGLHLIRAFVIGALSPVLQQTGYGLSAKEATVMVWGGLRGAVSLSLACLVDGNHLIGERSREMIFIQTIAIVSLTLLINGTTAGMVYKALQVSEQRRRRGRR